MKTRFACLKLSGWLLSATLVATLLSSCNKDDDKDMTDKTISSVVTTNTNFSMLATAVQKAGLTATLNGNGPFTVFAPNNDAFIASGVTNATISGLPASTLENILLYHTLGMNVMASAVPAGPNAVVEAMNGDKLYVTRNSSGVYINGVKVVQADISAKNGTIHTIERVLMPPMGNLVETAVMDTSFTYLVAAVLRASEGSTNVAQVLSGSGPFTVFAPTNQAFRNAGFATIASIQSANSNTLAGILTYHVLSGRVFSSDLTNGAMPATLNGATVTIGVSTGATVKGMGNSSASNVIKANIVADNGVIHVIDQVLMPSMN
jgi:uncharacterized surface protein with fasciclin (FAS1) repeats